MIPNLKIILTIAAVLLTLSLWAFIIWSINQSLNLGMGVGYEILVAAVILGLLLLLFPVILILPVYKCSSLFTLGVIWSITTFLYTLLPLKTYIDFKEAQMINRVKMELAATIDDSTIFWEAFKAIADKAEEKAGETKFTIMEQILNKRRFDLAAKMVEDGFDMRRFNMAAFLSERFQRYGENHSCLEDVKFMIDKGCNINDVFEDKNSLNITTGYNDTLSAYFLLERGISFIPAVGVRSPLTDAASADNFKMVQMFLNKGVDINHMGESLNTTLNSIVCSGGMEMIEFLIQNGASVNSVNSGGYSPLHYAIRCGNTGAIKILLRNGAEVNRLNNDGYDALYMTWGDEEQIRLLIEIGAVVNRTYPNGKTILSFVDKEKNPELWQYLYDRGARPAATQE